MLELYNLDDFLKIIGRNSGFIGRIPFLRAEFQHLSAELYTLSAELLLLSQVQTIV